MCDHYLAQRKDDDSWDVLDEDQDVVGNFANMEEAVAFIEKTGGPIHEFVTLKDETDGAGARLLEQRRKAAMQ